MEHHVQQHLQQSSQSPTSAQPSQEVSQFLTPPEQKILEPESLTKHSLPLEPVSQRSPSPKPEDQEQDSISPKQEASKECLDTANQPEESGTGSASEGFSTTGSHPSSLHKYSAEGGRHYRVFLKVHGLVNGKQR